MPRGDKSKYTDKQKRKAEHIEEGYESRGVPEEESERRAWATVCSCRWILRTIKHNSIVRFHGYWPRQILESYRCLK